MADPSDNALPATSTRITDVLLAMSDVASAVDVDQLDQDDLGGVLGAVRTAQRALDGLVVRLGLAAERAAALGAGRGAHGLLLGDGRSVRGSTARREARRAKAAADLPLVGEALRQGRIGAAHIDVLTQAIGSLPEDLHPGLNQSWLIEAAAADPVDVFARRVRRLIDDLKGDHGLGDSKAKREQSSWRSWFDERTGMGHVHGEFDPERYEAICGAVEAHLTRLSNSGGLKKTANLAAAASYELLTGEPDRPAGRPHIGVLVDWETFATGAHSSSLRETAAGHPVAPETITRLACDGVVQRIVHDDRGIPINVGRRHRTATDAQWLAIRAMYRCCAWAGCDRPLSWCQVHHIHEWEHGGPTDLCNLIPLCGEHHHQVHEGRWSLKLADDRRLDILEPDKTLWASTRPDRRPTSAPARAPSEIPAHVPDQARRRRHQPIRSAAP